MMLDLQSIGTGWDLPGSSPAVSSFPDLEPGMAKLERARQLVDLEYCQRLACGAIQQNEAGMDRVMACGLAYPMKPMGWCSDFCSPFINELKGRYGETICGSAPAPAPAPMLAENPLPSIVQPSPSVPVQALPAPLQPTATTFLSEVSCPSCETDCFIRLGDCCLTTPQVLALAALFVLGVTS